MLIEPKYIPVVIVAWLIVAWLIAAGFIIIPRFIKKKTVSANTTLGDIVKAIYSLKDTIYAAMGIGIGIILTVMGIGIGVIIVVITLM